MVRTFLLPDHRYNAICRIPIGELVMKVTVRTIEDSVSKETVCCVGGKVKQ